MNPGCTAKNGNYIFQCASGYTDLLYWWEISESWTGKRQICSGSPIALTLKKEVSKHCQTLSTALTHYSQAYIDTTEPAMEMYNSPHLISKYITNMDLLMLLHERKWSEMYPKMCVAIKFFAVLTVTLVAAERSFLSFNSLKLTWGIHYMVSSELSYVDVVDDFAGRKSRKVQL